MTGPSPVVPRPKDLGALFLVSFSVVLWEILLTRIYSVTLFYHFAFMAVSMAMFGLTAGAIAVSLAPSDPLGRFEAKLGGLALGTGVLMALAIAVQLALPLNFRRPGDPTGFMFATFALSALPFVPAGAYTCLSLTRFRGVGVLYAADLAGAGTACALLPPLIGVLGGPGAVLAAAGAACAAAFLQFRAPRPAAARASALAAAVLAAFAAANVSGQWLRVRYGRGGRAFQPVYETWNAFSHIGVFPLAADSYDSGGVHPSNMPAQAPEELKLMIDSGASTPITRFDGRLSSVDFLRSDITAFAHRLRKGDVLIIGPGGGRDILAALAFGQAAITAVEVNAAILRALNVVFGDFSGHLDRRPEVAFVADEGRSYLAQAAGKFDIIQASFVDTAAATAAGAYAFVENGLYTVEAWALFLGKLKPRGVLTMSRWYYGSTTWPVEVYRTLALAAAALRATGKADPLRHILILRTDNVGTPSGGEGIATVLVSPDPFTEADLAVARDDCRKLRCVVALSWRESKDPVFTAILDAETPEKLRRLVPLDITPPTDDRPYFFFHGRLGDILRGYRPQAYGSSSFNLRAVRLLALLAGAALVLGLALIAIPPLAGALSRRPPAAGSGAAFPLYFAAIGLAFMFIEIGLMQRLSLFLGHPTYGFTVVLFGLLFWGGLGSLASASVLARVGPRREWKVLAVLALVLAAMDAAGLWLFPRAAGSGILVRIPAALLLLGGPAFLMGFPFPMGMALVQRRGDGRAAWYWAVNGALSVIASVLAMASSLALGLRATVWLGIALYLAAALLYEAAAGRGLDN